MAVQISHKYKCIFIHVPKAGGTSIEKTSLFDDQRERTNQPIGGHSNAMKFKDTFPEEFNSYFKFAFVRNPWDRLVSAFFYLSDFGSNEGDRKIAAKYIGKYNKNFHAFCCDFLKEENINNIVHLRPQHTFICDEQDNILVDFVGKLENIEQDFKFVCNKLGCPYTLKHIRASKHNYYTKCYTDETKEIVERVYQKDIELLGYKYNQDWLKFSLNFWYKGAKNKAIDIRKVLLNLS